MKARRTCKVKVAPHKVTTGIMTAHPKTVAAGYLWTIKDRYGGLIDMGRSKTRAGAKRAAGAAVRRRPTCR